jgi:hypothetical protein
MNPIYYETEIMIYTLASGTVALNCLFKMRTRKHPHICFLIALYIHVELQSVISIFRPFKVSTVLARTSVNIDGYLAVPENLSQNNQASRRIQF